MLRRHTAPLLVLVLAARHGRRVQSQEAAHRAADAPAAAQHDGPRPPAPPEPVVEPAPVTVPPEPTVESFHALEQVAR